MPLIFVTGSSGFVGTSFLNFFKDEVTLVSSRGRETEIDSARGVIHLAGKAQDLNNTSTPDEYYEVNSELANKVYDTFLASDAKVFITLSSVKAVADEVEGLLIDENSPNPITHYGKSK